MQLQAQLFMTQESSQNPSKSQPDNAQPEATAFPQSERMVGRVPAAQVEHSLAMAKAAVKATAENRGQEIMLLDLTGQTSLFDFFVIASGASRRQLNAISAEIERILKSDFSERKLSIAGHEESRWIILDYGCIVVHLFDEDTRGFYDLESLWADSQQVDISDIVAKASAHMAKLSE